MKKIYMVKKNPNMPESEDNWIMMNGYEFARFMETEEGKSRRKNFAQIDACGEEDDIYVVECGEERAKEWRSEKDAHDYLKECEAESGIETVSFDVVEVDGEELSLEEVVADPESDVVEEAFKHMSLEQLSAALDTLSDDEYYLIFSLYLRDEPYSEYELSRVSGIPRTTISYRKKQILEKLVGEMLKKI